MEDKLFDELIESCKQAVVIMDTEKLIKAIKKRDYKEMELLTSKLPNFLRYGAYVIPREMENKYLKFYYRAKNMLKNKGE